ncbi:hypothetical protein B296_00050241 [Ensete ventricosum]|uniref:Uncharacterized protein n=1 Tax=Ensete ventricosum TaxID=4639 RepID=A0A426XEQ4_ENSVE|nr:hypothetical protein B296_00050241 [Ensete ventricosum]
MLLIPSLFPVVAAARPLPLFSSFQSAFFTAVLLSSSIAAASYSSPPTTTLVAAPPNRRAPVPQHSLLSATPSALAHNSAASASCCCNPLMPLSIVVVTPICCLQLHPLTTTDPLLQQSQPQPKYSPIAAANPSSILAATNRCHLLPSSLIAATSSSSLPLSSARPQQHTASIDDAASRTALPAFCSLFHAAISLDCIIILPKGGLLSATSVPPLLICRRPAFGSALPCHCCHPLAIDILHPLAVAAHPHLCRSCLCHLSSSPFFLVAASLALKRAFLPLHLHHRCCQLSDPALPNLFLATAAIVDHNCCPSLISSSASSVAIVVSPHPATCR